MNYKQPRPPAPRQGARSATRPVPRVAKAAPKAGGRAGSGAPRMPRKPVAMNSAMAERLAGIRNNMQVVVILGMVILAFIALAPQAQTWFGQQQQLAELRAQVNASKQNLAHMATERKRWNDPVYIRSQARDRLYYVLPGEVSYLVMGAEGISSSDQSGTVGAQLAQQRASATISNSITRAKRNWVNSLMQSVVRAGIDEPSSAGATTSVGK